jgi:hypothetical protein
MSKSIALLLVLTSLTALSFNIAKPASYAKTTENAWETMPPVPETEYGIRASTANGKIYVMGDSINYEYDPATDKWTEKTPMLTPRTYFSITTYQNKIYAVGGRAGFVSGIGTIDSNANEVYNPSTDTWQILTPMPINISDIDANAVNGKIYMIGGGVTKEPSLPVNLMYDTATDSWTNKSIMPYPAVAYASAVVNNKIYIIYGNLTQIYDTRTDSWSLGASIPTVVSHATAGATSGETALKRIYIVGGIDQSEGEFSYERSMSGTSLTQVYDPVTDTWMFGEPMPTARLSLTIAVVNDQIYAIGGTRIIVFSPALTTMERYTPFGYGTPDPSYDGVAPKITIVSPENKTYFTEDTALNFAVDEPVFSVHFMLDSGTPVEISGNTTLEGLAVGAHNVMVFGFDASGNMGSSETLFFTIEPFPTALVLASVITVAVVGIGLLVYFRKRKR